jgi:hypothetical protein
LILGGVEPVISAIKSLNVTEDMRLIRTIWLLSNPSAAEEWRGGLSKLLAVPPEDIGIVRLTGEPMHIKRVSVAAAGVG